MCRIGGFCARGSIAFVSFICLLILIERAIFQLPSLAIQLKMYSNQAALDNDQAIVYI